MDRKRDRRNTDHDEDFNRQTWRGCEWLGAESMFAPKHGAPIDWLERGGVYQTRVERKAQ